MKPIAVLILVLLVAAGAAYFFLNVKDEGETDVPDTPEISGGTKSGGTAGGADNGSKGATLAGTETDKPALEPAAAQLRTPAAVLLLANSNVTWTAGLQQAFEAMEDLSYATWFFETTKDGTEPGGPTAGPAHGIPAPKTQPTGEYLETNDVRALLVDTVDPNALPKAFWETVARRVNSGRMGLYLRPSTPAGQPPWSVYPALSHPVLKDLVPVAKARSVSGTPLPGLYSRAPQSLTITSEGLRHPATRLVPDVDDSTNAWASTRTGDGAFETQFVYPVESAAPGAVVLMELDNGDYPALIASGGNARVLWQGTVDFGGRAEFVRGKKLFQTMVITHWIVWLVGQAE